MSPTWKELYRIVLPGAMRVEGDERTGPFLELQNYDGHKARISMFGGQLLSWQPAGHEPVLWLSDEATFDLKGAIRGGVPICWPWFGDHAEHAAWPSHGFVRTIGWEYAGVEETELGTYVRLVVPDAENHRPFWPHSSEPMISYRYGETLQMTFDVSNYDTDVIEYGEALHSYFAVGDIGAVSISGLEGATFFDKLTGAERRATRAPITIDREIDRIYRNLSGPIELRDACLDRTITITHEGASNVIVWNPWLEKSARLGDIGPADAYRRFVCIETGNAAPDAVTLRPGESHTLKTEISVRHGT